MALLEVRNLKTYFHTREGIVRAVDDVSFDVERGQTVGIVGESGSGKSVTCFSMMRLIPEPPGKIEGGTAMFDGMDLLKLTPKEIQKVRGDRITMIFQEPMTSLNPYLKISTQLIEPLQIHRENPADAREAVSELMRTVGLDPRYMRKYPHEFSGGQRQRIAIARALGTEPKLVIADEPVSALDVSIQSQILNLLSKLSRDLELTMIFISHDLSVVRYIADRIAVMDEGKIVEVGEANAVFDTPQHEYTQTLLKAIPQIRV
ncbi:UNVERIFIED_CONTAM: hypothetical protein GTU68_001202 [Idotea baltica]|nr:hypothetical protein [Idotea baltica]